MNPDDVDCRKRHRISISLLDDLVLIEGDGEALLMLSELLAAHARGHDCGLQLSPTGAGNELFTEKATHGLYLHRTGGCSH